MTQLHREPSREWIIVSGRIAFLPEYAESTRPAPLQQAQGLGGAGRPDSPSRLRRVGRWLPPSRRCAACKPSGSGGNTGRLGFTVNFPRVAALSFAGPEAARREASPYLSRVGRWLRPSRRCAACKPSGSGGNTSRLQFTANFPRVAVLSFAGPEAARREASPYQPSDPVSFLSSPRLLRVQHFVHFVAFVDETPPGCAMDVRPTHSTFKGLSADFSSTIPPHTVRVLWLRRFTT